MLEIQINAKSEFIYGDPMHIETGITFEIQVQRVKTMKRFTSLLSELVHDREDDGDQSIMEVQESGCQCCREEDVHEGLE